MTERCISNVRLTLAVMPDNPSLVTGFTIAMRLVGSERWQLVQNEAYAAPMPIAVVAGEIAGATWRTAQDLPVVLPF